MPKIDVIGQDPDTEDSIEIVYLPMKQNLKSFLELLGIYSSIKRNMEKLAVTKCVEGTEVISNIVQARLYKRYLKNDDRTVIPCFFSIDDAEARNPLSSHAGEEKLGLGYITIPVLEPHLVSNLDNVFLALVYLAKYKSYVTNNDIFSPLIAQLTQLSQKGINININGVDEKVYFDCLIIVGDKLGLNQHCGFTQSFNSKYYCRICHATSEDCKYMIVENIDELRTEESYAADVLKKERGVVEECTFNRLPTFHITKNRTLDLMHDLVEGVGKDTVEMLLTQIIIINKKISLSQFNERLKQFNFGYESSNRPRPLKTERCSPADEHCYNSKTKIKAKQSASQMACLLRYLGFFLDDLIPTESDYWKQYVYLRKIIGLTTAPHYVQADLHALKFLISKFLHLFANTYRIKPKPHFMVHIPLIMKDNGPLVHFWSMTTERKHRFARKVAAGTSSLRDLAYTIALKNQSSLCLRNMTFTYDEADCQLGPMKTNDANALFRIQQHMQSSTSCTLYKHLIMFGHKFEDGTVFIHGCDNNGDPIFAKLKYIVKIDEKLYFYVYMLDTKFFNEHYHAYEIAMIHHLQNLIPLEKVERKPPCLLYKNGNDEFYATSRYD